MAGRIPKKIHYVWLGGAALPEAFARNVARMRALHPAFETKVWTEAELAFDCSYIKCVYMLRLWARAADYFRLKIVLEHGGIYVDVDVEPVRSFAPLLEDACFLGFQQTELLPSCVNNAVLGAAPGHWLIAEALERLRTTFTGAEPMDDAHGPGNITRVLRDHGLDRVAHGRKIYLRDVALYPPSAFYPFGWESTDATESHREDAYAVHRWAKSWVPRKGTFDRTIRPTLRRLPLAWRADDLVQGAARWIRANRHVLRCAAKVLAWRFDRLQRGGLLPGRGPETRKAVGLDRNAGTVP
jgi:mannosyltransferase OCH1-like enzyme